MVEAKVETAVPKDYLKSLAAARTHFGVCHISARRIAKSGATIFGLGCLTSWQLGPQFVLSLPLLVEWYWTSRARREGQPDELIGQLLASCSQIEPKRIAADLLSYNRKGHIKMAAQFLARLHEVDTGRFSQVMDQISFSRSPKATRIQAEFLKIMNTPSVYRTALEKARQAFSDAYLSATRIIRNAVAASLLINYTPVDDIFPSINHESTPLTWLASSLGIYIAVSFFVDLVRMVRSSRMFNANALLDDLVQSSQAVKSNTIARDLTSSSLRGLKRMGKEYLLKLKEAGGEKFNEVVALLQESRRGASLALLVNKAPR